MDARDETNLLQRCRQGESGAWDELFDHFYTPAARFVFQLSPAFTPEDVEEICQETFLSVVKNIRSFKGGSQFQTWDFRIAGNKARDYRSHQQAQKRGGGRETISLDDRDGENMLSSGQGPAARRPDEALIGLERRELLFKALAQVGETCREIIELRYFGDLSYEELAVALELNPKTVSSRLSKCLDRLEVIARPMFGGKESSAFPV